MSPPFKPINFEAAGISPEQILDIRPTEEETVRIEELAEKKKKSGEGLTPEEEEAELDHHLRQEYVLDLAKLRALEIIEERQRACREKVMRRP
jgi:uncharacterized protein YnzC (UPF0291/DUF896 family)